MRRVIRASHVPSPIDTSLQNLPGDPSLLIYTNVDMDRDKKVTLMKAASKAVSLCLSKPESYVAVCVMDGLDLIWAGSDQPAAIGTVTSLGSINLTNNKQLSKEICSLLADTGGIPDDRVYLTFFDVPRENMGYKSATFAG